MIRVGCLLATGLAAILVGACGSAGSGSSSNSTAASATSAVGGTAPATPSLPSTPLWSPSSPERQPTAQELTAAGLETAGFGPKDQQILARLLGHPTKAYTACILSKLGLTGDTPRLEWLVISLRHFEAAARKAEIVASVRCAGA